ncbi:MULTISPECIES: ABC transporter permease [unclassified Aureimonas]|uniref:ABC transporter permease n=1 Tax=unclassified Aureimonas TaxID=2615206 RepID=UPI0006FDEADA|nr:MULTISPECIES: ABC transporter permease [unclassified Aureimonas]KQT52449.1 sugar ABC transporter permease [Aureimonas sp. Leaf427]KQT77650.1 sugar ABC transporter permease [Aureimonas sp. Leaf460]
MSAVMTRQTRAAPDGGFDARRFLVRYGLLILLLALVAVFSWLRPSFASAGNVNDILRSASISALMFLGLTWIIAAGEIDVSFMSVAALSTMIVAGLVSSGFGWPVAAIVAIAAGVLVGLLNGFLVAWMQLPALVITIATGGLAGSVAAAIGKGTSIPLNTTGFAGALVDADLGIVPVLALLVAALYALAWFLQDRTTFGHYIYAMEQNPHAVEQAGVPSGRLLFMLYVLSGTVSALAGVLLCADLSSGQPYIGSSYFIDGLTAVLLGGMALKMGKPNVAGTITGVLLLGVLLSGAALLGWTDSQRQLVRAALLIAGVALVVWTRRKTRAKL